ncbi:uncharacterized protein LOC103507029 [Diaphorina citri]|uniref:Uncharacterized protein LOC103507029 n=1 Tax=Diaphorina citri TaxID=121845 RepID=A0A3Q0IT20_DIACI|nr:uncharacterized protein LOC103507029 [Diaphorina citri]
MMLDTCGNLNATGSPLTTLLSQFLLTMMTKSCEFGNVAYPDDRSNDVLDNHVKIDMVVVGSGSSGSVIANRLSEVSKWNVLLIEAGDNSYVASNVPGLVFTQMKTSIDWAYQSEKQPGVCEGLQNGVCNVPRGKALGGSSNMNAMMYLVGNPNDYNSWGNSDWNFKNVEKYFHKSFKDYYYAGHACEPLAFNKTQIIDLISNAGKELNLHKLKYTNKNINPNKVGILHMKTNIKNGERLNVAKAFLAPIKDRPNLFVMKNTLVTKILLENKKATGVQVYKDDKYYTIKFSKELIISAGAVNTPQLLFQSGIGDEELLKKENIDVKMNLPSVGKYLYDHPLFVVPVEMTSTSSKRKKKGGKSDDSEFGGEGNKDERKDEKKQHEDEFIFGEPNSEETSKNDKKKDSGRGKSKKHHKQKGKHGERHETDIEEDRVSEEKESDVQVPSTLKPEQEEIANTNEDENEKLETTTRTEVTSTTTASITTTGTTVIKDEDNDDETIYDEEYSDPYEKVKKYKRSPRHKNKKHKNHHSTTELPETKTVPVEQPKDFPPSDEIYKYIMERAGPLAGIGTGDYVTFIDTTGKSPNNPNVIIMYCFYPKEDKSGLRTILHAYNWNSQMINAVSEKQSDILLMIPMLLKPISYGNITFTNNVQDFFNIFSGRFQNATTKFQLRNYKPAVGSGIQGKPIHQNPERRKCNHSPPLERSFKT